MVENTNQDWPFPLLVKIELSKSVKMGRHQQKKSKAGALVASCRVVYVVLTGRERGGRGQTCACTSKAILSNLSSSDPVPTDPRTRATCPPKISAGNSPIFFGPCPNSGGRMRRGKKKNVVLRKSMEKTVAAAPLLRQASVHHACVYPSFLPRDSRAPLPSPRHPRWLLVVGTPRYAQLDLAVARGDVRHCGRLCSVWRTWVGQWPWGSHRGGGGKGMIEEMKCLHGVWVAR